VKYITFKSDQNGIEMTRSLLRKNFIKQELKKSMSEDIEVRIRKPDGSVVSGIKIGFKTLKEDWNEYELEDGTKLYIKLVLVDVVRLNEISPIGEPVYQILSQNIVRVKSSKRAIQEVEEAIKKEKTGYHE
jgi:phage head maturation protease